MGKFKSAAKLFAIASARNFDVRFNQPRGNPHHGS